MGEGSRVIKRLPSGCRERLRQKPDPRGMQRVPSKVSGLHRLPAVLEGEPFKEVFAQHHLGAGQPVEVSQVSPICLRSFTSSPRKWFSRKSQSAGSVQGKPTTCRSTGAWIRFFCKVMVARMVS